MSGFMHTPLIKVLLPFNVEPAIIQHIWQSDWNIAGIYCRAQAGIALQDVFIILSTH